VEKRPDRSVYARKALKDLGTSIYNQLDVAKFPEVMIPSRQTNNIYYDPKLEQYVLGSKRVVRSADNIKHVKPLAQLLWVARIGKELIDYDRVSTLRDLFYMSKNIDINFVTQQESDEAVYDLEALLSMPRESFNIFPHDRGAIFGDLTVRYRVKGFKDSLINLTDNPDGVNIGPALDNAELVKTTADKVIAIEKGAIFIQMIREKVHEKFNAILIDTTGQASRSARLLIRRLNEELGLPVYILTDCDVWGAHISMVIISGSVNSAHITGLNTPSAKWLGFWPTDINRYKVPTMKMKELDWKRLAELKADPRYKEKFWKEQLDAFERLGLKAELEAFSSKNKSVSQTFLVETYIPDKLKELGAI